jgi:hypothetical protein
MPKLVVGADRRPISAEVTVAWVSQNAGSVTPVGTSEPRPRSICLRVREHPALSDRVQSDAPMFVNG